MFGEILEQQNMTETAILVGIILGVALYFGMSVQHPMPEAMHHVVAISGSLG